MDENTPPPGPESQWPSNPPPPPPPLRPAAPPVIPAPIGISAPPKPPKRGSGWKIFSFLLLGLIVVWLVGGAILRNVVNAASRSHSGVELSHNLEEVTIEHAAATDNKIAVVEITGARHDLGSKSLDVPALAVDAALGLLP